MASLSLLKNMIYQTVKQEEPWQNNITVKIDI